MRRTASQMQPHLEAVAFTKMELRSRLLFWGNAPPTLEGKQWFGAVAFYLHEKLKISIGAARFEYTIATIDSPTVRLPLSSAQPLFNAANRHFEGYALARFVCASLLGDNKHLPEPLNAFASLVISGKWHAPGSPLQAGRRLPSAKNFLRDIAIIGTLEALRKQFGLAPTSGVESQSENGASILSRAIQEMNQEVGGNYLSLDVSAINKIWGNRFNIQEIDTAVEREILGTAPHFAPQFNTKA